MKNGNLGKKTHHRHKTMKQSIGKVIHVGDVGAYQTATRLEREMLLGGSNTCWGVKWK